MKINIKQEFIIADIKETKNEKYKILILGSLDFSGTMSFLVEKEMIEKIKERDLVEVEYFIQVSNEKIDKEYKEIIKNKRLVKISTK